MIDIQIIRTEPDRVREAMKKKGYDDTRAVDTVISLDTKRRTTVTELQEIQTTMNTISKEIGQFIQRRQKKKRRSRKKPSRASLKKNKRSLRNCRKRSRKNWIAHSLISPISPTNPSQQAKHPAKTRLFFRPRTFPLLHFLRFPTGSLRSCTGLLTLSEGLK